MKPFPMPVRSLLAASLALAALPAFAQGQPYSKTVFFGDSLTDSGHFRPALVQSGGPSAAILGRFTTNPGLVWSEFLADYYGTSANSANQGGSNYAVGGARTGTGGSGALGPIPSMTAQLSSYLAANGGRADPNALYTVWGGANDLFAVVAGAPAQATIASAVTSQVGIVGALTQGGARYILVPNIPDLGQTPQSLAMGPAAAAAGTQLATTYNNALYGGLASAGLRVIPLDTFSFLREITASPAAYGLTNVTGMACGATSSVLCSPANYPAGAAESYLFADGVHPTTGAHRMLAQYATSVLEGPRQIAVLPHVASAIGRGRAERVAHHVEGRPQADGVRWWGDLRGDFLRYDHGDNFDGAAPAGTFGVDWSRGSMVYGVFGGYGRNAQDYGRRGGSFDQSDATLGGFAGWYGEHAWFNVQASYSQLSYDIDREVQIGPVTRRHSGSPDGSNIGVGVAGGFQFGDGALRHGPVASVLAQRIEIDGYTESNPSATALVHGDQEFDSLLASVGWQFDYSIHDHLRPYARLTLDRELEKLPEQAFAQLQTMPGVAPYAVPGVEFDRSYGTAVLGARTSLFGLHADLGLSTTVGQKGGTNAGAFLTLSGSF